MSFVERRQYPRVRHSVQCQVAVGAEHLQAVTENLSCGGALCNLARAIAPMTRLDVLLDLPPPPGLGWPHQSVRCHGVVVRQDRLPLAEKPTYLTAIYFSDLAEEDRRRIGEFVLQCMLARDRRHPGPDR